MLLDLLLPKTCLVCNRWGAYVCYTCSRSIEYIAVDACYYCEKRSPAGITHEECKQPGGLDGICCFMYYTPVVQQIMKKMKYHLVSSAYQELFSSLSPVILSKLALLRKKHPTACLQPVPLHMSRFHARGFNQADYISRFISDYTGYPIASLLYRRKATAQQAKTSSRIQRYWNIYNAFSVVSNTEVKGKTIILVDDVVTSGNTVKEAARVLKQAGAERVLVVALSRR